MAGAWSSRPEIRGRTQIDLSVEALALRDPWRTGSCLPNKSWMRPGCVLSKWDITANRLDCVAVVGDAGVEGVLIRREGVYAI